MNIPELIKIDKIHYKVHNSLLTNNFLYSQKFYLFEYDDFENIVDDLKVFYIDLHNKKFGSLYSHPRYKKSKMLL